ncbi:MAG: reverse transcriptase domain-containing protein [Marinifilaceae bacterium]
MKRIRVDFNNIDIYKGYELAKKNKGPHRYRSFDKNRDENLKQLCDDIVSGSYTPAPYKEIELMCDNGKLRRIKIAPFRDLIVQHAVLELTRSYAEKRMIRDSYCCIIGRGQIACYLAVCNALKKDTNGTRYFSELDICKFYPTVNIEILKTAFNDLYKGEKLHRLHCVILDSSDDLPIGNPFSPFAANVLLDKLDKYAKHILKIKYYYRYADDIRIMGSCPKQVLEWQEKIKRFVRVYLKQSIKATSGVHDIHKRPMDFMGYIIYPTHTRIRKRIKKNAFKKAKSIKSIASYYGIMSYADCNHLMKKLIKRHHEKNNRRI